MKNLFLTSLFIVALSVSANATNYSGNEIATENSNFETLVVSGPNTFCKLIQKGDLNTIKSLIEAGANVNQKSVGMTPLMYAARHNKIEIVKLLIEKGAKLKTRSDKGYTALKYAKMSKANAAYDIIKTALEA